MTFHKLSSFAAAALALVLSSCGTPKHITYFQDSEAAEGQTVTAVREITIRPNDKISIIVNCKSPELSSLFNLPYVTQRLGENNRNSIGGASSQGYVSGYTVSQNGTIAFPVLGEIEVAGLTRAQIAEKITSELKAQGQASDAVVTVDFMNLYYQVLGEVSKPGRYAIDKDAITLLDAIGTAGDLTIYGQRENVKVMREEDGKMKTYQVNLCSAADLLASPVYYIQQNDIIYVDPNPVRARQSTVNGNNVRSTSFWISIASLASSIALIVLNAVK